MTDNRIFALAIYGLLLAFAISGTAAQAATPSQPAPGAATRPNVLVILADDLGYADLNIDNPRAGSPTPNLNALAQGGIRFTRFYTESTCSPSRAALLTGRYPARANFRANGFGIPVELTTLPEAFQAAGYRTHMIGKWHLGHLTPLAWPDAQGFDTWLGFISPWLMTNADRSNGFKYGETTHLDPYLQNEKGEIKQFPGHLTDIATDEAIRFIRAKKDGQPWFMYLAYYAPHEPIQPRADYAAKFADTPAGRYAAMVAHLDDRIGDVLQALNTTGQRDGTIVVFASDNGGTNNYLDNNAPFAGHKMEYFEGGVRTPLLISWPGKAPAGLVAGGTASIMDIYPTLATLARLPAPTGVDGRTLLDNKGALIEKSSPRSLFWELGNLVDVSYSVLSSDGRWRLYREWLGGTKLLDLQENPTTNVDVAASHPDIVRQLQSEYDSWKTGIAHLNVTMHKRDAQGHGILTGDDLQRAVDLGEFTIALGITPAKRATAKSQVILEQDPTLKIDTDDSGLHVQLQGLSATLPSLPEARCTSLVITGFINRPIAKNDAPASTLNIYLDGKKVSSIEKAATYSASANLQAATFVGSAHDGSQKFDGALSPPIYLNSRADGPVPRALTVQALTEAVCGRVSRQ